MAKKLVSRIPSRALLVGAAIAGLAPATLASSAAARPLPLAHAVEALAAPANGVRGTTTTRRAAAATASFTADADTMVDAARPTATYGTATRLRVETGPEVRTYLRFTVRELSAPVARATLRLSTKGAGQYSVRPVAPTWSEASTSYANAPAPGAATASFRGANGWVSVDVTPLVQANGVVSLAVTSASARLSLASRETRDVAQLTVELASPPPPPQTPAPAATDRFGMSAGGGIHNEPAAELARDLDTYSALGVRWVRVSVNWAVIQDGGPTSFNWAPFDAVVDGARNRGANVLALIEYTPRWARPAGSPAETPPTRAEDYAAFAGKVAERYSARGVHAFEVWNEPNVAAFWRPTPDVEAYTRLLRAASASIRAADPQAFVLTGGTSPATDNGADIAPVTFLRGVYANGGKGAFDAVAHHPYCWPADPGDPQAWSAWHQMYGTSPSLRSVMTANGDGGKTIWATEFGAPTNGPSGSSVSEADQSRMLAKGYALFGTYAWAGPLFWYSHRDLGTTTDTRENFFGLLRNDFSPKPSYSAYRTAVAAG